MTQILSFPLRRLPALRRTPAARLVAALLLIFFSAAVVWTTIISAGDYCLTTDVYAPPAIPGWAH